MVVRATAIHRDAACVWDQCRPRWSVTPLVLAHCCSTVDWGYVRGNNLRDPTRRQLGEYYGRLLSWFVKGQFVDENGKTVSGGPKFDIDHWEVFNEPDTCRTLNPTE